MKCWRRWRNGSRIHSTTRQRSFSVVSMSPSMSLLGICLGGLITSAFRKSGNSSEQLRRLSHELRPTILDDLGLLPAVEFLAEGVSKRTGLSITVEGSMEGRAGTSIETALYLIVQEALNNVTKHAHATNVSVRLQHVARQLRCSIRADAVGFAVPSVLAGLGKQGLRLVEIPGRASTLTVALSIAPPR